MRTDGVIAKILVPIDFSSGSERAWTIARRLAAQFNAELLLMHVLPATPVDMLSRYAREEALAAEHTRQADHQLGIAREDVGLPALPAAFSGPFTADRTADFSVAGCEWAAKLEQWASLAHGKDLKVATLLRVGTPYREILATASEEEADVIVMATHGRGEIHRLVVGSVADKIIRLAPCPVLTVRDSNR
jgi:nucleotide-binding universal stress UspA family protein